MTEVPEHLLQRSKAARARLTGEGGGEAEAEAPAAADAPTEAAATPAVADAAVPAVEAEPEPPAPVPPYVEAAERRPKFPVWVVPVLLLLPVWGFFYAGTLERPPAEGGLAVEGDEVYNGQGCAGCHGGTGAGGAGPQLNDGEVLETFPDPFGHVWWVVNGSPAIGTPYGNPDRAGGQRAAGDYSGNPMAAFGETLSAEEVVAVVYHERVIAGQDEAELEWMEEWVESGEFPESFADLPSEETEAVSALRESAGEVAAEAEGGAE